MGNESQTHLELLKSLFPWNDRDDRGFGSLHRIVLGLDPRPLKEYLLTKTMDLNDADNTGSTALTYAAWRGDFETVRLLLMAGANPNVPQSGGRPPMCMAAIKRDMGCVKLLLQAGAKLNAFSSSGWSVSHFATHDESILDYLLVQSLPINATAHKGVTPLHYAVNCQNFGSVKVLLKRGAQVNTTTGLETPLLNSLYEGSDEIMELLLAHGADYTIWYVPKNSALHLAAM